MAELVLIKNPKVKTDPEVDAQSYKAGDVLAIKPDGFPWSPNELTNPDWRILRLTRITDLADLAPLLQPEYAGPTPTLPQDERGRLMRRRRNFVDLNKLPAAVRTWWLDDTRVIPIFESSVNRNTVLTYITPKVPRPTGQGG